MNNFRRRVEGEIKLVSTSYRISSVTNKNIVIVNPNHQLTIFGSSYSRDINNNYKNNPYICVTCNVVFTKKETYSDGSVKTSTINASFTNTNAGHGVIPGYDISNNGDIRTWTNASNIYSSSLSGEDKSKCSISINLYHIDTVINTSSPVGTVGSGSFTVKIKGNPLFISNYTTEYSVGVVNTTLTKTSDTTFSEVLST